MSVNAGDLTALDAGATRGPLWIESIVFRLTEYVAGLIVAAEVIVLSAGVFSRYVMSRPLTWTDELASILFIWLAMLGAAAAFQRSEHMRMTALISHVSPRTRAIFEALALAVSSAFVFIIFPFAWEFAHEEQFIVTPALEISAVFRAAALPAGFGLMCFFALCRLWRSSDLKTLLLMFAVMVGLALAFASFAPVFKLFGNWNLVIFFLGFVVLGVCLGIPIGFVFALSAAAYIAWTTDFPLMTLVGRMDEGMSHLVLLAIPLFVFLGLLMEMTGMARAMVGFLATLVGHLRGGLSYVLIGAMYLVSGISGSKTADMAAVAPALFPEMKERGAKPGELVALLAATGAQTETIPPSFVLITVGSVTGVSIAALFTGGLMPALVLAIALCAVVAWRYRTEDLAHVRRASRTEIYKSFLLALPALILPFVIRAAVVEGVATATEVSTIGIGYSILIGILIYRRFDVSRLMPMLVSTAVLSGTILFIVGAATAVGWCLTQSGFSRDLASAMIGLPGGANTFLVVTIVAFIILGSFLEGVPAIVLFAPLTFPIAKSLHIHEVHYTMVVILAMGIGLFLPPFGVGYYAACAIGRVDPKEGLRAIWGYMIVLALGTLAIAFLPWLSIGFL